MSTFTSISPVACIPEDNGKTVRTSWDNAFTVGSQQCDSCQQPARVIVRGEQDSFGWEPRALCHRCAEKMDTEVRRYEEALDVEDRRGHFWVSEGTNHDGHGDWFRTFTSYREAAAFYRRVEAEAAPWGGLYPDAGVREGPAEEIAQRRARREQALRRQIRYEEELARKFEERAAQDDPWDDWDEWDFEDDV